MELWIRSQNKGALIKVEMLGNINGIIKSYLGGNQTILGEYKSSERALEVLDEIQDRFHQTFICDLNCLVSERDYKNIKSGLEHEYPSKEFMIQPQHYELKPINSDVVIYEMPVE